jgi:hypothetical protein
MDSCSSQDSYCVKSQPSDHQAESASAESSLLAARRIVNEGHGDSLGPAKEELPRLDSRRIVPKDHMLNESSRSFYKAVNAS